MITILHGDYIEASRNELHRLREKAVGKEVRVLDGRGADALSLTQITQSSSLFGTDTLVILERVFGKLGRQTKKIEEFASIILNAQGVDCIIWEEKELGSSTVKLFGTQASVRLFKLPVLIFQLLDGVRPGNAAQLLSIYAKIKDQDAPELVHSLLVKRVRQLIQIADGIVPEGLAPWQQNRLTMQSKSFTMDQLLAMHALLHDSEARIKTGMSPFSMAEHIEQFFITL